LTKPVITIDYTPAYQQGAGIGRLVRNLVQALFEYDTDNRYRIFVSGVQSHIPLPFFQHIETRHTRLSPVWLARLWHRLHLPLPVEFWTGKSELYHATDFVLPPTLAQTKTILTVHDLSFVRVPETTSPNLKRYLDVVVPRSLHRATHIIADSQATKTDITDIYDVSPHKVSVVLSGVDAHFHHVSDNHYLHEKYNIPTRPFLLSVGTVQPRKNYSRLIQSLAILRQKGYDIGYVIAGGKGWLQDEMYTTIQKNNMQDYVHLIGFADENDLSALYSMATALVYPSLYEGFGFPILEGMACHTPVITANVSSLPEVAGDATLLVDPYNIDEIVHSITRLLDDSALRQTLIQKGIQNIQRFTWQNSAKQLVEVYQSVLKM
jgi:glycosyltransferase involved in cell wall biosynthesis